MTIKLRSWPIILTIVFVLTFTNWVKIQSGSIQPQDDSSFWGLDPSFGNGGIVYIKPTINTDYIIRDQLYILPTGKLLVAVDYSWRCGKFGGYDYAIIRLNQTGEVEAAVSDGSRPLIVGMQSNGRYLLIGYDSSHYLMRFNGDDFSVDPSFVITDTATLPDGGCCFAVQPDDKILFTTGLVASGDRVVRRFNSNGSIDPLFPTDIGPFYNIDSLVSHSNGNFLVQESYLSSTEMCSARIYSNNGSYIGSLYDTSSASPDNHCGGSGIRFAPYPDGGYVWSDRGIAIYKSSYNGALDINFGTNGVVKIHPDAEIFPTYLSIIAQPDGNIVAAGIMGRRPLVLGLKADGSPDETFAKTGDFIIPIDARDMREIALQSDGKIVLAGISGPNLVLIRLAKYEVRATLFLPIISSQY